MYQEKPWRNLLIKIFKKFKINKIVITKIFNQLEIRWTFHIFSDNPYKTVRFPLNNQWSSRSQQWKHYQFSSVFSSALTANSIQISSENDLESSTCSNGNGRISLMSASNFWDPRVLAGFKFHRLMSTLWCNHFVLGSRDTNQFLLSSRRDQEIKRSSVKWLIGARRLESGKLTLIPSNQLIMMNFN